MSGDGMARSASSGHKQAIRSRKICDEVLIWPCVSRNAANRLERFLIASLKPKFNKRRLYSGDLLGITDSAACALHKQKNNRDVADIIV